MTSSLNTVTYLFYLFKDSLIIRARKSQQLFLTITQLMIFSNTLPMNAVLFHTPPTEGFLGQNDFKLLHSKWKGNNKMLSYLIESSPASIVTKTGFLSLILRGSFWTVTFLISSIAFSWLPFLMASLRVMQRASKTGLYKYRLIQFKILEVVLQ